MKSSNEWMLDPKIKSSILPQVSSTSHGAQQSFPSQNCKLAYVVRPAPLPEVCGPDSMLSCVTFLSISYLFQQNL